MSRFGTEMVQIGPKWDKSRTFLNQISVHLASNLTWLFREHRTINNRGLDSVIVSKKMEDKVLY